MFFKKLKSELVVNFTHFSALCRRYISLIFSDKISLLTLLFQAPIMLVVIKISCHKTFNYVDATVTMFIISVICVIMATLNSYREICKEREILIRETNAGLDSTAYILSKVCVQGAVCLLQALILVIGTSFIIEFNISHPMEYVRYFFVTFLTLLTSTCVGLFISAILKNSDSAILPVLFIIIAQVVLSDTIVPLPENLKWLSCVAVARWAVGAYSQVFGFSTLEKAPPVLPHIYELSYLSNMTVLISISIVCIILSVLAVKKFRKRKM